MSRFQKFIRQFRQRTNPQLLSQPLAIDLGSVSTRVAVQGKIFITEASCIARHKHTQQVISVGTEAQKLIGKTPPSIEVIFPVRRGKVQSLSATKDFLTILLQRLPQNSVLPGFLSRTAWVGIPADVSTVDKHTLQKVFQSLAGRVEYIPKSYALVNTLINQGKNSRYFCMIDIGGMTTEMSIFSENQPVVQKTFPIGGEDFTQAVIDVIRKTYHCEVGWETAEKVKRELGKVLVSGEAPSEKRANVRGRDVISSLPTTITVQASAFQEMFTQLAEELFLRFREVSQETSPDLLAYALEPGIFLTGGGSLLLGLGEYLSQKIQSPVTYSQSPFEDVVKGL